MKKTLITLISILVVFLGFIYFSEYNYLFKAARITWLRGQASVGIYDYTVQDTRTIEAGNHQAWELHKNYNKIPLTEKLISLHKELNSNSFLIIKDGKILSETYFNNTDESEQSALWSISKTYTSFSILKAIDDGLITDVNAPVKDYIEEWNIEQSPTLSLRHLASMSAGLYWEETDQKPWSLIAKYNFHDDLDKLSVESLYSTGKPGDKQHYNSGGTQLLGTILRRLMPNSNLSEYISDNFWKPLGCKYDAIYILDSKENGAEKSFGGMVATARDISRLGQVIVDNGIWRDKQILSPEQMKLITNLAYNNTCYNFGLWSGTYKNKPFYLQAGFGGQAVISFPSENLVITRLGHNTYLKPELEALPKEAYIYIEEVLKMTERAEIN